MVHPKRLFVLFMFMPLLLPLMITVYMLNIHHGYSSAQFSNNMKTLARKTMVVVDLRTSFMSTKSAHISKTEDIAPSEPDLQKGERQEKHPAENACSGECSQGDDEILRRKPTGQKPSEDRIKGGAYEEEIDKAPALDSEIEDDDPFLSEWRQNRQNLSTQHEKSGQWLAMAEIPTQKGPALPQVPSDEEGNRSEAESHLLNLDLSEDRYLGYTTVQGVVVMEEPRALDIEVAFLDRLAVNGLESEISTVLAAQQIDMEAGNFYLRLPAESQGYLLAKAYAKEDTQRLVPLLIGAYPLNPLRVPKQGMGDLIISLEPADDYLNEHQTLFSGKIFNEYEPDSCLVGADVWVVETRQHVTTNERCVFKIPGLLPTETYHFIFEKESFMTLEIPVVMENRRTSQTFKLSSVSKFERGYDLFLGPRNDQKATVFATVLKEGKPLERAIVVSPLAQVVYEHRSGEITVPAITRYSTDESGKVIFWNMKPGRQWIDVYFDGRHLGTRMIRLSPGVVHHLDLNF